MNSSKKPLIVALVFTFGVALGLGWKLGLIPVQYGPAKTGTLEEADQAAAEDVDGAASAMPLADAVNEPTPEWTADQGEPPVEEGVNRKVAQADLGDDEEPEVAAREPDSVSRDRQESPRVALRGTGWNEDDGSQEPAQSASEPPPFQRGKSRLKLKPADKSRFISEEVQQAKYQTEDAETVTEPDEPKRVEPEPAAEEPADRFAEIDAKLEAGELLAAHKLMSKMLWNLKGSDPELQTRLEAAAKKIFFSPQPHFIEPYVVQPGDQLQKVAKKYGLSWEYLAKLNKTDPRRIREGQKLKVLKGPFAAIVSLRDFSLTVHLQGYYVKRYQVGIGKDGTSPIGKFPVLGKLIDPQYTDPDGKVIDGGDPANPLGKRWIDLGDSYGIHGTIEPDSIGKAESRGCIRLRDADILEVYDFLVSESSVEIRE